MADESSFPLEIAKLVGTGAIGAWIASRLTSRQFLAEKHWQTKFEHYNKINEAMSRTAGLFTQEMREQMGSKIDDERKIELAPLLIALTDAVVNGQLIITVEASNVAAEFLAVSAWLDSSDEELRIKSHMRIDSLQRDFQTIARRELGFEPQPTLVGRLLRLDDLRRFFRAPRGSTSSGPRTSVDPRGSSSRS